MEHYSIEELQSFELKIDGAGIAAGALQVAQSELQNAQSRLQFYETTGCSAEAFAAVSEEMNLVINAVDRLFSTTTSWIESITSEIEEKDKTLGDDVYNTFSQYLEKLKRIDSYTPQK